MKSRSNLPLDKNSNFLQDVALGEVPGFKFVDKFGANFGFGTTEEDVWDVGGTYDYQTTAEAQKISSSDAGDDQDIVVFGLDADGNEQSETVTLNGQTPVDLANTYLRNYRAYNNNSTDLAGDVYIYGAGATVTNGVPGSLIRAKITQGYNQTLMAIYTIPKGYKGLVLHWDLDPSPKGKDVQSRIVTRESGKVFRTRDIGSGYQIPIDGKKLFGIKLDELTDIKLRAVSDLPSTKGYGGFEVLLVDKNILPNF